MSFISAKIAHQEVVTLPLVVDAVVCEIVPPVIFIDGFALDSVFSAWAEMH